MTGPANMNQVLFQTPTVEKIQSTQQHTPEMLQREALLLEQERLRQQTETVRQAEQPEPSRHVDNEHREKQGSDRKKKRRPKTRSEPESDKPASEKPDRETRRIINVVV